MTGEQGDSLGGNIGFTIFALILGTLLLVLEWDGLLWLALVWATRSGHYAGLAIANIFVGVILGGPAVLEMLALLAIAVYAAVKNNPARRLLARLNVWIWIFLGADMLHLVFFAGAFGMFV